MKKIITVTAAVLSAVIIFSACTTGEGPTDTSTVTSDTPTTTYVTSTTSSETTSATTAETNPEPRYVDHVFNPHVISSIDLMAYGKDYEDDFYRFCDAVLEGADTVRLDDPEFCYACLDTGRYCLPIVSEMVCNIDPETSSLGNGIYRIEYTCDHDEYMKEVGKFKARVEELIERCIHEGDNDLEKAIELYSSEARRLSYDYDAADESIETNRACNPYHSLMEDSGICQEIAGTYAYLLLQAGIDAGTCGSLNGDNSQGHEWTVVRLGGRFYHCDVTFQLDTPDSLRYFGMTDEDRNCEGDWQIDIFNFSGTNKIWHKDIPCEDERFADIRMCDHYELDNGNDMLSCYFLGGPDPYLQYPLEQDSN